MEPQDQEARTRFATELDRNFSVVAAAGSGKTRAVTDRIVQMAQAPDAVTALPRLVVLTFANRAADEMQQRARQEISKANVPLDVVAAFNRAWFGTIHAFCLKLLSDHGHHLGLPTPLDLITDDEDLWNEFVQGQTSIGHSLSAENRAALLRLAPVRQIMELGRKAGSALLRPNECCACPEVDFAEVYAAAAKPKKSETTASSVAQLQAWEENYRRGFGFVRWPVCSTKAGGIDEVWSRAFKPLRRWVNDTALCVAAEVQRDYRNFRLERGVVTYADQIALADELLQHPEAARRLRQLEHIIILDEAQDTDPAQFNVLLEMTRAPEASGRWLTTREDPPRPGAFCMAGDFQQSIYHDRADLAQYQRVHDALVTSANGAALTFSVTFRLDQTQVDFINETFAGILHGESGQVGFVQLQPRPEVLPGQVIRIPLAGTLLEGRGTKKLKEHQIAAIEADELARWLQERGPAKLRARSWRDVAVLCPRRDWLRTMATALLKLGLPVEIQSESDLQADSPAYAWLTALCTIMAQPRNGYEIVGVLREVYGISDHDLAVFSDGDGARFQIEQSVSAAGIVSSQLAELTAIRAQVQTLPLFAAVELLVERTALRSRIAALPAEDFNEPLSDLDTLLTLAAEAETARATLPEFAERLRSEMERQRPVRLSTVNAIQLITAQKAKGSEWDAVIVPFLSRKVIPFSPRYPSIVKVPDSEEAIAALYKEDREDEVREALKILQRQEMERLLYVALTRARHTLVLALDRELFASAKEKKISEDSQLSFLRGDTGQGSAEILARLPEDGNECADTIAAWKARENESSAAPTPLPAINTALIEAAKRNANAIVRKHNPSGFTEPDDSDVPVAGRAGHSIADNPATLYGSWWHSLFEHFPWKGDPAAWTAAFETLQPQSPDPKRSASEWRLLTRGALRDSMFTNFLAGAGVVIHTEFPLLWRMDEQSSLEGVIDLLAVDLERRSCLLIDWKTNRIAAGEEPALLGRYRPQLSAYWKAVTEITGFTVEAGLYSTSTGKLLIYSPDDLAAEWSRLSKMPVEELQSATAALDFH